jgi:hypothetical protein
LAARADETLETHMTRIGPGHVLAVRRAVRDHLLPVKANFWVKAKVPETKGKSLKQIQAVWAEHDPGAPGGTEGTPYD